MVVDSQYVWIADHKVGLWRASRCDGSGNGYVESATGGLWDLWWYNSTGAYPGAPDVGYYIYSAGKDGRLNVHSTAAGGARVGSVATGAGIAYGVFADASIQKAYVATTSGLFVYSLTTPTSPTYVTTIRPDLSFIGSRGAPGHRYMIATSYSDNKLYIIDTQTDSVVSSLGFGMTGMIRRPWLGQNSAGDWYAYVVNDYGDLWIVNMQNPASPAVVSYWNSPYGGATNMPGGNVWVRHDYAYVMTASGNSKGYLYLLDVRDPANPALVDYLYDNLLGFNEIRVEGCVIQVAAHNGWKLYRMLGWQPDSWISNTDSSNWVGQNIYEATPAVQVKQQTLAPLQTATYQLRIENDADRRDKLLLRGAGGAANWTVQYLQGASDITTQVVSGTFQTGFMEPGDFITLTLKVTPGLGVSCPSSYDVTVTPSSWMCPEGGCASAVDAVMARTNVGCPQMTLAKDDGQTTVYPGDPLPYRITYRNAGSAAAAAVVLTETIATRTWSCWSP